MQPPEQPHPLRRMYIYDPILRLKYHGSLFLRSKGTPRWLYIALKYVFRLMERILVECIIHGLLRFPFAVRHRIAHPIKYEPKIGMHTVFVAKENILFLEEWIKYHKDLGVDYFFLYDNSKWK